MSQNIYVAINGDDVGERIGNAIAQDDHEGLASASSSIKGAHDSVDQWAESVGGKKITGSGDEAIYLLPEEALNDLDSIRDSYKEQSGHGLTVGVGSSMSEASKALIYGKLNGKNQTVHYEPSIDDALAQDGDQDESLVDEDQLQDQSDEDTEQDFGVSPEGDDEQSEDQESDDMEPESEDGSELPPQSPMASQSEQPPIAQESESANEDELAEDNQMATDSPAAPMANPSKAQAPVHSTEQGMDGKVDEDFGTADGEMAQDSQSMDEDSMPGTPPQEDLPDTEEEASAEDDMQGDMPADQETSQDEDPLASMIHGDMQGDGEEEESPEQDEQSEEDSSLDDELRSDIAAALMAFKENKDMLEQAREQNPKLYQATITMLRSMIEMAKKLGYAPEQDMQDSENNQQLQEEFPAAEDDMEQEESENPEEQMESEEEDEDPSAMSEPPAAAAGKK
jgi:midasin